MNQLRGIGLSIGMDPSRGIDSSLIGGFCDVESIR